MKCLAGRTKRKQGRKIQVKRRVMKVGRKEGGEGGREERRKERNNYKIWKERRKAHMHSIKIF